MKENEIQIIESSDVALEQHKADLDLQVTTAKMYPRDLVTFKNNVLTTIGMSTETAASCNYYLPRAGKTIEGPSIRLAEIVASNYGNLRLEAEVLGHDGKFVSSRAMCHDLQTNNAIRLTIKRKITNKQGKTYSEDMIQTTGMAAASIALRNAIFKIIPRVFVDQFAEEAKQLAIPPEDKFWENVDKWLKWFSDQGVSNDRVLKVLGVKSRDHITNQHLVQMSGIHTSIKTGEAKLDDIFPNELVEPQPLEPKETESDRHMALAGEPTFDAGKE